MLHLQCCAVQHAVLSVDVVLLLMGHCALCVMVAVVTVLLVMWCAGIPRSDIAVAAAGTCTTIVPGHDWPDCVDVAIDISTREVYACTGWSC